MELKELKQIVKKGESFKLQFKETINNADQLAAEMVAFSNAQGGKIIIGVTDKHKFKGISETEFRKLNQLIANASTNNVLAPIYPATENVCLDDDNYVIVITVFEGLHKPYCDRNRTYWIKNGSDKRRALPGDIKRLIHESQQIDVLEQPLRASLISNLAMNTYRKFHREEYGTALPRAKKEQIQVLNNKKICIKESLTLAGALLFSKPKDFLDPLFCIKAVSFVGNDPATINYRDSEDIYGPITELFSMGMTFIKRNLRKVQKDKGFNTLGELEAPELVFEELLVNALIHRDYVIPGTIRLFIFDDRIEIISPGRFPGNLSVSDAKKGIALPRNPILVSYGLRLLPYRGLGTGIRRALNTYKNISIDNQENQVVCTIKRDISLDDAIRKGTKLEHPESVPSLSQVCPKSVPSCSTTKLLKIAIEPVDMKSLMEVINQTNRTRFRKKYLKPLINEKLLQMTIPDKPNSSKQKYIITEKGRKLLKGK